MNGINGLSGYNQFNNFKAYSGVSSIGKDDSQVTLAQLKSMKRSGIVECETCASRKYQDGSDESNVSFKSASHVSPEASAGAVKSHEAEHVSNAYAKASKADGKVVNASVTLKTAVCPECGRSYVAGGVTNTAIKYNTDNKYGQNQKSADYSLYAGNNIDYKS
ncbi:MAG: hypothetical protein ACI4E1_07170 [Lachnospira sp.]